MLAVGLHHHIGILHAVDRNRHRTFKSVAVIGNRKGAAGIVGKGVLPLLHERIDHPPAGLAGTAVAGLRRQNAVPFADHAHGVGRTGFRIPVERHFDQTLGGVPNAGARILPQSAEFGKQAVAARLDDDLRRLDGFGPLRLILHGISGPGAVHLGQQAQRTAFREAEIVGRTHVVVIGPRQHVGGIFQVLLDKRIDLLRRNLLEIVVGLVGLGSRGHQRHIAEPAHQFEIVERTQGTGFGDVVGRQLLIALGPSRHAAFEGLDAAVGVVDGIVERIPRLGDLLGGGIVKIGGNLARRGGRITLDLRLVGAQRKEHRKVVAVDILRGHRLVDAQQDQLRFLHVVDERHRHLDLRLLVQIAGREKQRNGGQYE